MESKSETMIVVLGEEDKAAMIGRVLVQEVTVSRGFDPAQGNRKARRAKAAKKRRLDKALKRL